VAVAHDGELPQLVLDAGTGLRNLSEILDGRPFQGTIVLSHLHWDHLMGLPFFIAGDRPDARVRVMVPEQGIGARDALARVMSPPLFPITPDQLRGQWSFETYDEGSFEVDGFTVLAREVPHSAGRTMGVRVSDDSGSLAFVPDHAPQVAGPGRSGVGEVHEAIRALAQAVDVLLHDSQYTRAELRAKFTWGHTAIDYVAELSQEVGVRRPYLFHHDPWRTDDEVEALWRDLVTRSGVPIEIGREGLIIDVGAGTGAYGGADHTAGTDPGSAGRMP
jgi:phosphoribosyl 1,2-cyclic phosphodiesterase